ncbi:hypothetical protein [Allorhizocola rhizosphaerae]|uniref:hypothetical protein n=1 Tax=Allorhizocola rhizosphaerae TaxID=1872709 RepID=UPI000E3D9844|nr:hypothetical protein [Allorhizocola rhizosphaerae]
MRKTISRFALAAVVGASAIAATAAPAQAATIIGGINVDRQCKVQHGSAFTAVVLDTRNAYSWRCHYSGYLYGVDMNSACINQYGGGAFSVLLDPGNAYSWRCAR